MLSPLASLLSPASVTEDSPLIPDSSHHHLPRRTPSTRSPLRRERPNITVIVACGLNRAIGKDNGLLWRLPDDMRLFRANTLGRTVLMGRNTAESIGRALPKRRNLVWTSRDEAPFPGQEVVHSLEEALNLTGGDELCVIGGARVYAHALPVARRLKITVVEDAPEADTFLPPIDLEQWQLLHTQQFPEGDNHPPYTYSEYVRRE